MGGPFESQAFASEIQDKVFPFVALEIQISGPLLKVDAGRTGARVSPGQFGKFYDRAGHQSQGASVFKLDLGACPLPGAQFSALRDRQVDESFFVTLSQVTVDLHIAVDLAQTNDTSLRVGKGRKCQRTRQSHQNREPANRHVEPPQPRSDYLIRTLSALAVVNKSRQEREIGLQA